MQRKSQYIAALRAVGEFSAKKIKSKKLGRETMRQAEMEYKRYEAERRKAAVMSGIKGGMKHTARAMLSRS